MAIATYKKIASVTVGSGGATSIEFTNIPASYDDLSILLSVRNNADNYGGFYMRFNGSSSSYSARRLRGDGSSAASDTSTEINWPGSGFTASTFGNISIYIPNYRSLSNKSASVDSVAENNATTTRMNLSAYLWSNTSVINSIAFGVFDSGFPNDKFVQYSTATLYGIVRSN